MFPVSMTANTRFHFKHVEVYKGEENSLGVGSYGAVYKAKCDELPCAAKILHPVLFQSNDPGARQILQRFEQECQFMNEIRHPNIVLYLGVCRDCESNLPILLMELLDESLTRFLQHSKNLLFHTQLDICHDVALALSYLHANGIVHRDLSSNNVLLVAGSRAKVSDFGMSKLMSGASLDIRNAATFCPGTEVYMSPEAMKQHPVYTEKLDCFSFGVLVIQVLTGLFPNPGPRTREVEFSHSPTGTIDMPVLETERRNKHIQLIDVSNPVLPIAISCLNYNPCERPTMVDICKCLVAVQTSTEYTDSKQVVFRTADTERTLRQLQEQNSSLMLDLGTTKEQLVNQEKLLLEKEHLLEEKDREIEVLQKELVDMNQIPMKKEQELSCKEPVVAEQYEKVDHGHCMSKADRELADSDKETSQGLSEKDLIISRQKSDITELKQRLHETERDLHSIQRMLLRREAEIIDQRQRSASPQIARRMQGITQAEASTSERLMDSESLEKEAQVQVMSTRIESAISKMARGSTAVNGSMIYLRPAGGSEIYVYDIDQKYWSKLPLCPLSGLTLVMVGGILTAIGVDESRSHNVNILLCYLAATDSEPSSHKWSERFPVMLTKRYNPAAVCSEQIVVVAGGNLESGEKSNIVEVMDTTNQVWFVTPGLPVPISQASAVICKNNVYLIGGVDNDRKWVNLVLTCNIDNIRQHILKKQPSHKAKGKFSRSRSKHKGDTLEWHLIANLPVGRATCACLDNSLLAVGGVSISNELATGYIHRYNADSDCWEMVGQMTTPRSQCLVASLENKAVVVGGWLDCSTITDNVEILKWKC